MRIDIVFDNNVAKKLKQEFPSDQFNIIRVQSLGWETLKNGDLIAEMATHDFKILVTHDKDMWNDLSERKVKEADVAVIILDCHPIKAEIAKHGVPAAIELIESRPESGIHRIDVNEIIRKTE